MTDPVQAAIGIVVVLVVVGALLYVFILVPTRLRKLDLAP